MINLSYQGQLVGAVNAGYGSCRLIRLEIASLRITDLVLFDHDSDRTSFALIFKYTHETTPITCIDLTA